MKEYKPYLKIKDAVAVTGLSSYFLRNGCVNGTIPHIKSGTTYFINMTALFRQLDEESTEGR